MIRLYDFKLSGSCHRVRLPLSMLGLENQLVDVELLRGEQNSANFLQVNPLHKMRVLENDGFVLRDSAAILVYLAEKYGRGLCCVNQCCAEWARQVAYHAAGLNRFATKAISFKTPV